VIERKAVKNGPRYEVRLRGPDGRERSRSFRTLRDAERYEREQRRALDRGDWIDPRNATITFEEYAHQWMHQRTDLRPRTVALYESLLRRHLLPEFGSLPVGKITPGMVRSWNARLAGEYVVTGAKAYRPLRGIMTTAVADELILRSPCVVKGAGQERSPERPMLSIAEVDALAAAMPEPWRITIDLAAWCHLRVGEVLGLERRDVDMLHARIKVERTAHEVGGRLELGPPKTAAGLRTLSVPPHVLRVLEHHLSAFVRPEPSSPLLVGEKGGRLGRHPLNEAWSAARAALGRPEIHFHDLRGAGLTWAATQGATTRELMARAGHASPAAALRYQHATADRDAAIAAALSGLAESARRVSLGNDPRDIRGMNDSTRKEEEASQRSELDPTRERPTRIELASSAWKAEVLPLNYGRGTGRILSPYSRLRERAIRPGRG
jgi:integrase